MTCAGCVDYEECWGDDPGGMRHAACAGFDWDGDDSEFDWKNDR